jgi:hypothetical protein
MNNEELNIFKEELIKEKSLRVSVDDIINQIKLFEKGIPQIKLERSCTINDGIKVIPDGKHEYYLELYQEALKNKKVTKFVPASGAASRMFKKQQTVLAKNNFISLEEIKQKSNKGDENRIAALEFIENINKFAFYDELKEKLEGDGKNMGELLKEGNTADIFRYTIEEPGLNYVNQPKGSIKFHSYPDGSRTAFEEHIVEAIRYAKNSDGIAKIHFTISPDHSDLVKTIIEPLFQSYKEKGEAIEVSYSYQKRSTNTIAVTKENKPFRDSEGYLLFRPAGHGALLENLNELEEDIIFIKNIDNIVPDHLKGETYNYKMILAGYLVELQKKIFNFLLQVEAKKDNENIISEILKFIESELEIEIKNEINSLSFSEKTKHLFKFLNRPIRACGMVKKGRHPGGGPFWIRDNDGNLTRQVVETTQMNLEDEDQRKILESATHFSPVDFICGIRDYNGKKFNLKDFANPDTGLITTKSKDGKELKALELPGLWNGGMYNWITLFVEVPPITFNPVKEVNDLLKPEHQPLAK